MVPSGNTMGYVLKAWVAFHGYFMGYNATCPNVGVILGSLGFLSVDISQWLFGVRLGGLNPSRN